MNQEKNKKNIYDEYKFQVIDANIGLQNSELISKLRDLTLHGNSGMNIELDNLIDLSRSISVSAYFITAYCIEFQEIIAWALLTEEELKCANKVSKNKTSFIQIFTDHEYRGNGIGKQLFELAKRIAAFPISVWPWDDTSRRFFNNDLNKNIVKHIKTFVE